MSRALNRPEEHAARPDDLAFDRYVVGESPREEHDAVERWLREDRADCAAVDAIRQSATPETADESPDASAAVARLIARLSLAAPSVASAVTMAGPARTAGRTGGRGAVRYPLHVSAATLRVAGVAVLAGLLFVIAGIRHVPSPARAMPARVYATATGQRATVRLGDGTRVMLAPRSSLVVPGDFGRGARTVSVAGEAYFEVNTAARAPFVVRAGDVRASVLGTVFDVRRYENERAARVAVITGRVAVDVTAGARSRSPSPAVVLSSGMVRTIRDSITATSDGAAESVGWTTGELVFRGAPVPDVLAELGRWYGLEFLVRDSTLARQHLSVTFRSETRAEVLAAIRELLDVSMRFDGNVVVLLPRRERVAPPPRGANDVFTRSSEREVGR